MLSQVFLACSQPCVTPIWSSLCSGRLPVPPFLMSSRYWVVSVSLSRRRNTTSPPADPLALTPMEAFSLLALSFPAEPLRPRERDRLTVVISRYFSLSGSFLTLVHTRPPAAMVGAHSRWRPAPLLSSR